MKQFAKQKWALSALLIAALGSQYYFSTSSNNIKSLELSSVAPEVQVVVDAAAILDKAAPAVVVAPATPVAPVAAPAAAKPAATATEGVAPTVPCAECVVLSREQAEKIRKILAEVVAEKTAAAKAETPAVVESALDKSRRLREEAAEAKRLAAQDKADKLRDERLARNDEFKDKMEEAADRCAGEISCITSRYTSLLSRYSGKRKIDMGVATAAYSKYIQPGLKASVSAEGNDSAAQETLRSIGLDIPLEYRAIKEASLDDVKAVAQQRAVEANKNFRLADQYSKAKKFAESADAFQLGKLQREDYDHDMGIYEKTLKSSLSDDSATLAYMQKNFMPEVSRLFTNMNNLDGLSIAESTASGSRNARGGMTTVVNDGKITTLNNNNNVSFGTPTTSVNGGRRGRN